MFKIQNGFGILVIGAYLEFGALDLVLFLMGLPRFARNDGSGVGLLHNILRKTSGGAQQVCTPQREWEGLFWDFGHWCLFGIWCFGFGIFIFCHLLRVKSLGNGFFQLIKINPYLFH